MRPKPIAQAQFILCDFTKESAEIQDIVDKVIIHARKIQRAQKVFKRFIDLRKMRLDFMKTKWAEYLKAAMAELFQLKPTSKSQKEKNKEKLQALTKMTPEL